MESGYNTGKVNINSSTVGKPVVAKKNSIRLYTFLKGMIFS